MKKTLLVIATLAMVFVYSCKEDEEPTPTNNNNQQTDICDSINVTFDTHIKAIVDSSCNASYCHATGGSGGFSLKTFAEVKAAAQYPSFMGAINQTDTSYTAMPLPPGTPKLSADLIEQLECWAKAGYPEK
jgi:hypothetical protein